MARHVPGDSVNSSGVDRPQNCNESVLPLSFARPDLAALYIYGYSSIVLIGIVANVLSVLVLARDKSRTTTRIFLLSLACVDSAILLTYWFNYSLRSLIELHQVSALFGLLENEQHLYAAQNAAKMIQVWLILVISADRYLAIHYPLHAPKVCTLRNAKIASGAIVVCATVFNIPRLFRYHREATFDTCLNLTVFRFVPAHVFHETFVTVYWDVIDPIMYFFIPLLSLGTLNLLLIRAVKKANALRERLSSQGKQENNITCTLVAIVTNFIVCESPTAALYGFELCYRITESDTGICFVIVCKDETALAVSNLLLLVNSSINFFLYVVIGNKFRKLFLELCFSYARRPPPVAMGAKGKGKSLVTSTSGTFTTNSSLPVSHYHNGHAHVHPHSHSHSHPHPHPHVHLHSHSHSHSHSAAEHATQLVKPAKTATCHVQYVTDKFPTDIEPRVNGETDGVTKTAAGQLTSTNAC